jgi:hypothetical protein
MTAQERCSSISHIEDFFHLFVRAQADAREARLLPPRSFGAGARNTGLHSCVQRLFTPYSLRNAIAWRQRRTTRTSRHARRTQ